MKENIQLYMPKETPDVDLNRPYFSVDESSKRAKLVIPNHDTDDVKAHIPSLKKAVIESVQFCVLIGIFNGKGVALQPNDLPDHCGQWKAQIS